MVDAVEVLVPARIADERFCRARIDAHELEPAVIAPLHRAAYDRATQERRRLVCFERSSRAFGLYMDFSFAGIGPNLRKAAGLVERPHEHHAVAAPERGIREPVPDAPLWRKIFLRVVGAAVGGESLSQTCRHIWQQASTAPCRTLGRFGPRLVAVHQHELIARKRMPERHANRLQDNGIGRLRFDLQDSAVKRYIERNVIFLKRGLMSRLGAALVPCVRKPELLRDLAHCVPSSIRCACGCLARHVFVSTRRADVIQHMAVFHFEQYGLHRNLCSEWRRAHRHCPASSRDIGLASRRIPSRFALLEPAVCTHGHCQRGTCFQNMGSCSYYPIFTRSTDAERHALVSFLMIESRSRLRFPPLCKS